MRILVELLMRMDQADLKPKIDFRAIHITTIDKTSGVEGDIVLISMVNDTKLGFYADIRRATVALTRGKAALIVIGNSSLFK